jgi:hypothetical protein
MKLGVPPVFEVPVVSSRDVSFPVSRRRANDSPSIDVPSCNFGVSPTKNPDGDARFSRLLQITASSTAY